MKTTLLKTTRKLWSSEFVPQNINRSNQLKWARAVYKLGDKWLLVNPVQRSGPACSHAKSSL